MMKAKPKHTPSAADMHYYKNTQRRLRKARYRVESYIKRKCPLPAFPECADDILDAIKTTATNHFVNVGFHPDDMKPHTIPVETVEIQLWDAKTSAIQPLPSSVWWTTVLLPWSQSVGRAVLECPHKPHFQEEWILDHRAQYVIALKRYIKQAWRAKHAYMKLVIDKDGEAQVWV